MYIFKSAEGGVLSVECPEHMDLNEAYEWAFKRHDMLHDLGLPSEVYLDDELIGYADEVRGYWLA